MLHIQHEPNDSIIIIIFSLFQKVCHVHVLMIKQKKMEMTHKLLGGKAIKVFYQCYYVKKERRTDV